MALASGSVARSILKTCPACGKAYPGGEMFCPDDGTRLAGTAEIPSVAQEDPIVGSILTDRYRVLRRVGEGGMGVVYEAEHVVIEKRVAIKVLREDYGKRPEVAARFRQEARSASRIGHENIVDITDFGNTPDGGVFFAWWLFPLFWFGALVDLVILLHGARLFGRLQGQMAKTMLVASSS